MEPNLGDKGNLQASLYYRVRSRLRSYYHSSNPSIWEMEARGPEELQVEFKTNLGYISPCLKTKHNINNNQILKKK